MHTVVTELLAQGVRIYHELDLWIAADACDLAHRLLAGSASHDPCTTKYLLLLVLL